MSLVWAVPVVMVLVGSAAMVALLRATADSARDLGREVARFGELHAALSRVGAELQQAQGHARDIRTASSRR